MKNLGCGGAGPHAISKIKKYRVGAGILYLCFKCWTRENKFNYMRNIETGEPEHWPQQNWFAAEEV